MRNISKNYDDFMEFIGDAAEPIIRIAADPEIHGIIRSGKPKLLLIKPLCSKHKDNVAEIAAAMEGVSAEEFKASFSAGKLMKSVIQMINSPLVTMLFQSAEQRKDATSSGSATENSEKATTEAE